MIPSLRRLPSRWKTTSPIPHQLNINNSSSQDESEGGGGTARGELQGNSKNGNSDTINSSPPIDRKGESPKIHIYDVRLS